MQLDEQNRNAIQQQQMLNQSKSNNFSGNKRAPIITGLAIAFVISVLVVIVSFIVITSFGSFQNERIEAPGPIEIYEEGNTYEYNGDGVISDHQDSPNPELL